MTGPTPERAGDGAFWAWMDSYVDEPHNAQYEVPDMQRAYEAGQAEPAAIPAAVHHFEWAVFWGGEDPDGCAGSDVYTDEADADESRQWIIGGGLAKRPVWYGPWVVVTPSSAGLAPGEDPGDNLTEAEREEYRQWRAAKGLHP